MAGHMTRVLIQPHFSPRTVGYCRYGILELPEGNRSSPEPAGTGI